MATAWNKVTKRFISRINRPLLKDLPNQDDWVFDPVLPASPNQCVWDEAEQNIREMSEQEKQQFILDKEESRQNAKPSAIKGNENAYRALCVKHGLAKAVKAEEGLQDALCMELQKRLDAIGDPKLSACFEVVIDAFILQNLATKVVVDDIPDSGHQL